VITMTTASDNGFQSPEDYGLPSEEDIARLAAVLPHGRLGEYFPAFPSEAGERKVLNPALFSEDNIPKIPDRRGGFNPSTLPAAGYEISKIPNIPSAGFPVRQIRNDFPILSEKVGDRNLNRNLIWLDNAATTQKPKQVIERLKYFYEHENSNVHRGAHTLAARATDAFELAREKVAKYLRAKGKENIVFVRGTTEGINLVAHSFVKPLLSAGDEIILTHLEHHANIVAWQIIAEETKAVIKVAPVDDTGQVILSEYARLFTPRTKFAAAVHVSNALGTVTPVRELIGIAHGYGVRVLIDGAQSVSHIPVNVTDLDADFFVFSGHKIFGPTGIGALYGKDELLEAAKPYQGGGNMISDVTFERTLYRQPPEKFEAGTANIADAVGLGAALDYVNGIGIERIAAYEHELLQFGTEALLSVNGLKLIGTAANKASILSFTLKGHDNAEVGKHLSRAGIAVRAGHHCAQPILRRFGLEGTVRPSVAFYNTFDELRILKEILLELSR
jgi:cysteine desulfurase/selenocysteine lyase